MAMEKVAEISIYKLEDRKVVTAILLENGYTVGPGVRKKTPTGKNPVINPFITSIRILLHFPDCHVGGENQRLFHAIPTVNDVIDLFQSIICIPLSTQIINNQQPRIIQAAHKYSFFPLIALDILQDFHKGCHDYRDTPLQQLIRNAGGCVAFSRAYGSPEQKPLPLLIHFIEFLDIPLCQRIHFLIVSILLERTKPGIAQFIINEAGAFQPLNTLHCLPAFLFFLPALVCLNLALTDAMHDHFPAACEGRCR